jgi:hypothetical protein
MTSIVYRIRPAHGWPAGSGGQGQSEPSAGRDWARQPDPAGQGDDGAPHRPRPRPTRRLAGSRDGLDRRGRLWGATTGQGGGAFLKNATLPAQSRGSLAPYDHQIWSMSSANVTQVDAFDGATVGGTCTCMGVWESTGGSKLATVCGVLQGSVLVLKLAAINPLFLPETLIYSHRLHVIR